MGKTFLVSITILFAAFVMPLSVNAQENCVTVYGGGVVCGAKAPEHEPIATGIGDINPAILGGGLMFLSLGLARFSKKLKTKTA